MRKVYYNPMQNLAVAQGGLLVLLAGSNFVRAQQAPLKASSLESHEGLTISAQPWTDAALYKEKFPKKSPYAAGVVALKVAFRNDSDESLRVNIERIRLTVMFSS